MNVLRNLMFLLAGLVLLHVSACKDDPEPVPEPLPGEVKIADNVHVLDATVLAFMEPLDTVSFQLKFALWPSGQAAPKVGEIVVGGISQSTPYGVLRKVTGVTPYGAGYACTTSPAQLDEVILQGKIQLHKQKLTPQMVQKVKLEPGVKLNQTKSTNMLGFDMSFETNLTNNGKAKAYGSFYFEMGFNFDFAVSLVDGVQFESTLDVIQQASLGARAEGSWNAQEKKLGEILFTPWVIQVGPVPIVFVPKAALKFKSGAGISAEVTTYAWEKLNTKLGLAYDSRDDNPWDLINECNPQYDLQWPSLTSDASFWIKVGPSVSLKLYGSAGPFFDVLAKSNLEASITSKSPQNNYNLNYELWLEANAGIEISLLGFLDYDYSANLFEKLIYSLKRNGEPIPNGIVITSPAEGNNLMIGSTVPVVLLVNGQPTDGVKVYVDDLLQTTLTQSPYSWSWAIPDQKGVHSLKVEASIGGELLSHSISVNFVEATWTETLLSGLKPWETINGLSFNGYNNGMAVGYGCEAFGSSPCYGFIATTSDGGKTWSKSFEVENGFGGFEDVVMNGSTAIAAGDALGVYWLNNGDWEHMKDQYGEYISGSRLGVSDQGTLVVADESSINVLADELWYYSGNGEVSISPEIFGGTEQPKIVDIAFGIDGSGYFVGYSIGPQSWMYKTTDGGMSWNQVTTPGGANFELSAVTVSVTGDVIVTGRSLNDGPEIYKSTNGGTSWVKAQIPAYFGGAYYDLYTLKDVVMVDENIGYAAGVFGTLYPTSSIISTTNGGLTWTASAFTPQYPTYEVIKLVFVDKYHGWAGGYAYPNPTPGSNGTLYPAIFRFGLGK
jgi:photosystem II stability/assembly factor-like uncharacterized protein